MKKEVPQSVTNATLDLKLTTLTETVATGFKGMHERQDTTNGRITVNEKDLLLLREKFKYNRIVWYLFTVAVGLLVAFGSYILYHQ